MSAAIQIAAYGAGFQPWPNVPGLIPGPLAQADIDRAFGASEQAMFGAQGQRPIQYQFAAANKAP